MSTFQINYDAKQKFKDRNVLLEKVYEYVKQDFEIEGNSESSCELFRKLFPKTKIDSSVEDPFIYISRKVQDEVEKEMQDVSNLIDRIEQIGKVIKTSSGDVITISKEKDAKKAEKLRNKINNDRKYIKKVNFHRFYIEKTNPNTDKIMNYISIFDAADKQKTIHGFGYTNGNKARLFEELKIFVKKNIENMKLKEILSDFFSKNTTEKPEVYLLDNFDDLKTQLTVHCNYDK